MKRPYAALHKLQSEKSSIPDLLHFVWIGMLSHLNADYLDVWQKVNPDKRCLLWYDESSSCCIAFHQAIDEYVHKKAMGDEKELITLKNDAFNFIYPKIMAGLDFNSLVVAFLKSKNISLVPQLSDGYDASHLSGKIEKKDINSIFTGRFSILKKYYYYELILRCNLASASDIVRLIILYQYGGIYIDVDTLPFFDHLFYRVNKYLRKQNIRDNRFIALGKAAAVIQSLYHKDVHISDAKEYIEASFTLTNQEKLEIISCIDLDRREINIRKIPSLGKVPVYKHFLALGSLRRLKGIYYNNVIASHPHSKAVSIIIRSLNKRYRFIEKHNAVFELNEGTLPNHYLSRLLRWRGESRTQNYGITPVLTGPGLIIEVMLGLAYELVDFDGFFTPAEIADYMQNEAFGVAFFRHTLDTPQGLTSSWRS